MSRLGFVFSACAAIAFATAGASCGGGAGASGGAGGSSDDDVPFIAYLKDFDGFHDWTNYDVTGDADLAGIHDGSTVIEYINRLPPSGLTEFPKGTIIVKEATGGTIPHELFAMVKRGAGFNPALPGWEWYELQNLDDGSGGVSIVWSGFGPPSGDTYGGDAGAGCNTCHLACGNDGVCATPLNLANF
ncbi:MAG TPA: hypothetical protein VMI54_28375 [Polyangiaceae bacterium]|nr:hypothetical protein [Polyangiaceae bacterium]